MVRSKAASRTSLFFSVYSERPRLVCVYYSKASRKKKRRSAVRVSQISVRETFLDAHPCMQKAGWMFLPFAGLFVPASRVRKSTIAVGQAWARRGSTKSWPPTGLPYGEQPFATLHDSLHRGGLLERPPARYAVLFYACSNG